MRETRLNLNDVTHPRQRQWTAMKRQARGSGQLTVLVVAPTNHAPRFQPCTVVARTCSEAERVLHSVYPDRQGLISSRTVPELPAVISPKAEHVAGEGARTRMTLAEGQLGHLRKVGDLNRTRTRLLSSVSELAKASFPPTKHMAFCRDAAGMPFTSRHLRQRQDRRTAEHNGP